MDSPIDENDLNYYSNITTVDITQKLRKLETIESLIIDEFDSQYKYYHCINNEYILSNLNYHNNLVDLMSDIQCNYSKMPTLGEDYKYFDINLYAYIFVKKYRDNPISEKCSDIKIDSYKFVLEYNPEELTKTINTFVSSSG